MVFHLGGHDIVPATDETFAETVSHQIDRSRRPGSEDDFADRSGADIGPHRLAGSLVLLGTPLAHEMEPAMDVGVHFTVETVDRLDHAAGLLGRGAVVEIGQRLAVYRPREQRKIGPYFFYIESHHMLSILADAIASRVSVSPSTGVRPIT